MVLKGKLTSDEAAGSPKIDVFVKIPASGIEKVETSIGTSVYNYSEFVCPSETNTWSTEIWSGEYKKTDDNIYLKLTVPLVTDDHGSDGCI